MFRKHIVATVVATVGALLLVAHVILGVAGVMSAASWISGAAIGMVLLVAGGTRVAIGR